MTRDSIPDHTQREAALSPAGSFIVQAPAGSGKTELLVQRFLVLLAHAERVPEEIIAITFTRKAAAEMRQRILAALHSATLTAPTSNLRTWELAQAALVKDKRLNWNLLSNPHRLRVQTIDALCASLARQMPLLSGFGSLPAMAEDPSELYLQATRRLFAYLEEDCPEADKLAHLFLHLDNRVSDIEALFVRMLGRRDQWLPHVASHKHRLTSDAFRKKLEQALEDIVLEKLAQCQRAFPPILAQELWILLDYAEKNGAFEKPPPTLRDRWFSAIQLLLTDKNTWRTRVDKNIGFPVSNKDMKARMQALLAALSQEEALRLALQALRQTAPPYYTDEQWEVIDALTELLLLLVAELNVLFQERGVVDFSEISMAALRALGEEHAPTELALIFDQKIRHILIDEFQDTSSTQFALLKKLTQGWQTGDGRTLFLVGDPMQSIYRFREAEVGLFLKAQREGVGDVALTALQLQANFRSTANIVDWINQYFPNIFPLTFDISSGAVPFNASIAVQRETDTGVYLHGEYDEQTSAQKIVNLVVDAQQKNPDDSIAILVRSRTHLMNIVPALKEAGLDFNAVEIEPLAAQSITHDLLSLTMALSHLGNRLAWLAILRAPWCGLTLHDLHVIANDHPEPLWERLQNFSHLSDLSQDGHTRLAHIVPILADSLAQRGRDSVRNWVEKTWRALQGPRCVTNSTELSMAETFFKLLEEMTQYNSVIDEAMLEKKVQQHYVTPSSTNLSRLHVMTIHKAKGLEFDTVIVPHLDRKSRHEDEQLLFWLDKPRTEKANDLILAPIKRRGGAHDPIYRYVREVEKDKSHYEMMRLLYVAATRAKKQLHLMATMTVVDQAISPPKHDCFLRLLWDAFAKHTVSREAPIELKSPAPPEKK